MAQEPSLAEKRVGHLTEIVHLVGKYLINENDRAREDELFGAVAHMILDCYKDPLFKPYRNDKDLLAKDMIKSVNILEEQKIFGRSAEVGGYLVPASGAKINGLVTYDSLYGKIVSIPGRGFGINL